MAIQFPPSPSDGDQFNAAGRFFVFRTPPGVWESANGIAQDNSWIEGGVAISNTLDVLDGGNATSRPEPLSVSGILQIGV